MLSTWKVEHKQLTPLLQKSEQKASKGFLPNPRYSAVNFVGKGHLGALQD